MKLNLSNDLKVKFETSDDDQKDKKSFPIWAIVLTVTLSIVISITLAASIAVRVNVDIKLANQPQVEQNKTLPEKTEK